MYRLSRTHISQIKRFVLIKTEIHFLKLTVTFETEEKIYYRTEINNPTMDILEIKSHNPFVKKTKQKKTPHLHFMFQNKNLNKDTCL